MIEKMLTRTNLSNKKTRMIKFLNYSFLLMMISIGFFQTNIQNALSSNQTASEGSIQISEPFGICHGWGNSPTEANNLKQQGVQITRNDITWSAVEPENGTYNFQHYDDFFGNLSAKNIEALAILDYGNGNLYGSRYANHIPLEQIPHWLSFVNMTVSRYQKLGNLE
jgi:beta-glucosidase/6-phospho-beta-glucosidase/beta-galactosidase